MTIYTPSLQPRHLPSKQRRIKIIIGLQVARGQMPIIDRGRDGAGRQAITVAGYKVSI